MSSILSTLLHKINAAEAPRSTTAGRLLADTEGVSEGPELLRIRALPRRRWQDDPALDELVDEMTRRYKRPNAEDTDAKLFPVQAVALAEFEVYGRLTSVCSIGSGKTLQTGLLPTVAGAKRPLLLVPASLVDKTRREFKTLSKTWFIHPGITIFSYEKLSLKQYKHFLREGRFDLVMADESHMLKSPKSGRTLRVGDYVTEHEIPFVPFTGSPGDSSISNLAHYLGWSQGQNSPLPEAGSWELIQWCQATDESVREFRRKTGALSQFSDGDPSLDAVREGIGRRVEETPGVVYHRHASVDCSLYVDAWICDELSSKIDDVFEHVRETGDEMPDGRVIETPLEAHNMFATLALGFVRIIDPPPPAEWRLARKAHRKYVNEVLADRSMGFETGGEVEDALRAGELDQRAWLEWQKIQPTFEPISKVVWFSDEVVALLAEWMSKNHNTLVWTAFPAFGRALAKASGKPFFHRQGISLTHGSIEAYDGNDTVIVSTASNATGRNLQRWAKNLIIGGAAKADTLEQQIGRTHRTGQKADAVEVTFFVGSVENLEALDRARGRALIDKQLGRNHSSKLLACDWLCPATYDVLKKHTGPRWRKEDKR